MCMALRLVFYSPLHVPTEVSIRPEHQESTVLAAGKDAYIAVHLLL